MRETSKEAYANLGDLRKNHWRIILSTMREVNKPLIAEQIALNAGLEYSQVSRRMKELEEANKVACTKEKALTTKGRKAFKWILV